MDTNSLYKPVRIGTLTLAGNIFLAPVAGYSDKTYRSICKQWGADFTYTEMVSSEAFVRTSVKTEKLIESADNEDQYAVQIFGSNAENMAKTAIGIIERYHPACIDINAGCPMPKITKTGSGSALMRDPQHLYTVTKATVDAIHTTGVPVTVKIRAGWSQNELTWKECAKAAIEAGASALTIHPRTCAQCYNGKANWDIIALLTELVRGSGIPLFGSGDLFSPEDAAHMLSYTQCDGIMFARGAMGNPFIFHQTKELLTTGKYEPIPLEKKIETGKNELQMLCNEEGEERGCLHMRKRFVSYIKGIKDGARIREQIVRAKSISDYTDILKKIAG